MARDRWSRADEIGGQSSVKLVDADRHLKTVEGVGHDEVGIDVIASASDLICVGLLGAGEEQELCAGGSLETGQTKMRRLERLDAGGLVCAIAWRCGRGSDGGQRARDGMDAVKGTGQDEIVVGVELLEARCKGAIVDEPTGLVDDEQSKDDPGVSRSAIVDQVAKLFRYEHGDCARLSTSSSSSSSLDAVHNNRGG
jgi:hypothetical protein